MYITRKGNNFVRGIIMEEEEFNSQAERMLQEQPAPADDIDVRADFLEQMGALGYLGAGRTP